MHGYSPPTIKPLGACGLIMKIRTVRPRRLAASIAGTSAILFALAGCVAYPYGDAYVGGPGYPYSYAYPYGPYPYGYYGYGGPYAIYGAYYGGWGWYGGGRCCYAGWHG